MRKTQMADAITEYTAHLRSKGLADNTIKNHTQPLTRALRVWGDIQVATVKPVHIDRLFTDGNWSPRTRNLYRGALDLFFKWARHNGYMARDFDPLFGSRNQRVPRKDKMRLPVDEFYPLLDAAEHPRDRACLAIGLFLFLRGGEIQTLRVGDLDLGQSTIEVYRHKTKDYDTMPVSEELREEMVRWLNWYRADQGNLVGNWHLIPSKKPDEWTNVDGKLQRLPRLASVRPEQVMSHPYRVAQRALLSLGYDVKGEGEHTLRRSGARAYADSLREQGVDNALLRTASLLGHRDVRVTQSYIGWDTERDNRNEAIAGKPMFPGIQRQAAKLHIVGGEA